MRRYKVALPLTVHTADASYTQGEEFEQEFSAEDEAKNLASGLLELVPLRYRVIGESVVHGTPPGETFERAIPLGEEALLIEGRHIELVEPELESEPESEPDEAKPAKTPARKASVKKE